jgi:hypothetical protein
VKALPLIRIGQGDYRRDVYPEDIGMTSVKDIPGKINLRFLVHEPVDIYHAKSRDFLTAHALNEFRRCPLLYRKKELGPMPERDTTAYLIDRAAHALILEGRQRYERECAVGGPINPRTGQPFGSDTRVFAEWVDKQSKPVLSDSQAALVEQMAAAVKDHAIARKLLAEGVAEGVVRCTYAQFQCQARIDWINPSVDVGIVDLKTAEELDSFEFVLRALGYVHELAFYRALIAIAGGAEARYGIPTRGCWQLLGAHIVAVEKREPFRVGVWRIAPEMLEQAQAQNEEAMRELRRCRATGNWFTRFEELRVIDRL